MQVNAELRLWQHAAVLLTPPATAALTPACLKTSVCVCVCACECVSCKIMYVREFGHYTTHHQHVPC